jgi:hypothetical protein
MNLSAFYLVKGKEKVGGLELRILRKVLLMGTGRSQTGSSVAASTASSYMRLLCMGSVSTIIPETGRFP